MYLRFSSHNKEMSEETQIDATRMPCMGPMIVQKMRSKCNGLGVEISMWGKPRKSKEITH
jgi:hypothetical protein